MATEIDFPRGGALNPRAGAPQSFGFKRSRKTSKNQSHDVKQKKSKIEEGTPEEESHYKDIFRSVLSPDLLVPDVRGLAFVKRVSETEVLLECAEGIPLHLAADRISEKFTANLSSGKVESTLDEIFLTGQAIIFKVIEVKSASGVKPNKPKIIVTTCPHETNSHLVLSNFRSGLALNGAVMSIEEKGAIIDVGLSRKSNVTGFVQSSDLPDYLSLDKLKVGQVILFRVKSLPPETSRVIHLSAFPEGECLNESKVELNHLTPGTLIQATAEKFVYDGVFMRLTNGPSAFIRKVHLPPRLRYDISKFNKPIRICILCCQQNSPLLVLSGHPDILALSRIERRALPSTYKIGEKVQCYVYAIDKLQNIYFRLESPESDCDQEKRDVSLITAKALRIHIDEFEKNVINFSSGSEHTAKIIGYSSMERQLLVTTKLEHLRKNNPVSFEELKIGSKIKTSVAAIKPNGLTVVIDGDMKGYVTRLHADDEPSKKDWQKQFVKGMKLECRVLYLDEAKSRVVLTAKPSLVKSTERRIFHLSESLVGVETTGMVLSVLESGGLVIGFFNKVAGLMHASNTRLIQSAEVGSAIKVRVRSVDPSLSQMIVEPVNIIRDSSAVSTKNKSTMKEKATAAKPAKPFQIYTAKLVGPWPFGDTSKQTTAELKLPGGSVGRLHVSELPNELLAVEGSCPMVEFLKRNTGRTVTVKAISSGKLKTSLVKAREMLMQLRQTDRVIECTMRADKLEQSRKKLKLINYKTEFSYGDQLPVFVLPSKTSLGSSNTMVAEVNPFFKAQISFGERADISATISSPIKQSSGGLEEGLPSELIIDEKPQQMFDPQWFEEGELRLAKVVGVNRAKRSRIVQLTLLDGLKPKKKHRKRTQSEEIKIEPKVEDGEKVNDSNCDMEVDAAYSGLENPRFQKINDPGFDWSLSGFNITDLLKVGKRQKSRSQCEESHEVTESDEAVKNALEEMGLDLMASTEAYDQKLFGNPNSSGLWISYMAFFLGQKSWPVKKRYENAKAVAERALESINCNQTDELFNVWAAYLNLEVMTETSESQRSVFQRACGATDSYKMHKQLFRSYQDHPDAEDKHDDIVNLFELMLKKFRQRTDLEIWFMYARYLMERKELDEARKLMQRAIQCAEKKKHIRVLTQFAQLEEKYGDPERAKTMNELVRNYRIKGRHNDKTKIVSES